MGLETYRAKRDFERTPEPTPAPADRPGADRPRFVVHEHHARRLHWDLRLERDGVLASWAVPRGIPADPRENHLAVHTEDHPLEYVDFEGEIPRGQYGAGLMRIWDHGTYEAEKWREDEVILTFHGERLHGRYVLFRTRGRDWMIHRMDPPEDPEREPMPERVEPMLATPGPLPPEREDRDWAYEVKWDGVRAVAHVQGGRVRALSRQGREITERYPELRDLGRHLGATEAVLDGELVAFDPQTGRPSFGLLQRRMHLASESAVRRVASAVPVTYVAFDVLFHDGRSTLAEPYERRRERLAALALDGGRFRAPAHHVGDGAAVLAATGQQGLEGVVAKKLGSPYEPGRRSSCWVKVKHARRTRVAIGGWMPGEGNRAGRLGALLAGQWDPDAEALRYVGRVGTGFDEQELEMLGARLAALAADESPFGSGPKPPRGARFVRPVLECEVTFSEWTHTGILRHPVYQGLVG
jgi:bifunctional non-homologous end joining protein LigD